MRDMREVGRIGQLQGAYMEEVEFVIYDRKSEQILDTVYHMVRHERRERENGEAEMTYRALLHKILPRYKGCAIRHIGETNRNMVTYTLEDKNGEEMDICINARLHMWQRVTPAQTIENKLYLK